MKMKAKKALLTACAIGSYSEQSSEVLQCNWDPDRLPKGWCKAYHVAQNIKQIKENWSEGEDVSENWQIFGEPFEATGSINWVG